MKVHKDTVFFFVILTVVHCVLTLDIIVDVDLNCFFYLAKANMYTTYLAVSILIQTNTGAGIYLTIFSYL